MSELWGISVKVYRKDSYFLLKNDVYHSITNKKSFMSAVKDKRGEMQKFIKNNKLRFKKTFEEDVLKALSYYNQL